MSSETIATKTAKHKVWRRVVGAVRGMRPGSSAKSLINYLYNINVFNIQSIRYIDSLNWTHDAGDLYGRSHIVANPTDVLWTRL
jgi:hypothetical protein